jgi:O-antigen ligase
MAACATDFGPNRFVLGLLCLLLVAGTAIATVFHPVAVLASATALCLGLWLYSRPMVGLVVATILYPIHSFNLIVTAPWAALSGFELNLITVWSVILLIVMTLRVLGARFRGVRPGGMMTPSERWLLFCVALFFGWSLLPVLWSEHPANSAMSYLRMVTILMLVAYCIHVLKKPEQFVTLMKVYVAWALVLAAAAFYSTNHAFLRKDLLMQTDGFGLYIKSSLINSIGSGGYLGVASGLVAGFGLTAKHELAMFLTGGIVFSLFLFYNSRVTWVRVLLVLAFAVLVTMLSQTFSRIAMVGSFLTLVGLCTLMPVWRRHLVAIIAVFVLIAAGGFVMSRAIQPSFQRTMETAGEKVKSISTLGHGEFDPYSMAGRVRIWKRTIQRAIAMRGLGMGQDELSRDPAGTFHGHNLVLTLAAESGVLAAGAVIAIFGIVGLQLYRQVLAPLTRIVVVRDPSSGRLTWGKVSGGPLLAIALTAALVLALLEYSVDVFIYENHLWFMLGLLLACLRIREDVLIFDHRDLGRLHAASGGEF